MGFGRPSHFLAKSSGWRTRLHPVVVDLRVEKGLSGNVLEYVGMSFVDTTNALWKEVGAIVQDEGLQLYDLERFADSGLKVVVATPNLGVTPTSEETEKELLGSSRGQGGVTSDDCARVCRRLLTYFSVEGPTFGLSAEPRLEVCSPGINRSLRLPMHFSSAVGERVKIVWERPNGAQGAGIAKPHAHTTVGVLHIFDNERLSLIEESSGDTMEVLLNEVRKARVDFPF